MTNAVAGESAVQNHMMRPFLTQAFGRRDSGSRRCRTLLSLAFMATALLGLGAIAPSSPALQKGIIDARLEQTTDAAQRTATIHEIGPTLKARWVRLMVDWSALESQRGTYSPSPVARLDALVEGLHAAKVKVILTAARMPTWAQDSKWWKSPPAGFAKGPQPFYAIRSGTLGGYANLGRFLATHFAARAHALECLSGA